MKSDKVLLLTEQEYQTLNNTLSELEGFDTGKPTERLWGLEPKKAKINVQYDEEGNEAYDDCCVAKLSGSLQKRYPDILEPFKKYNL